MHHSHLFLLGHITLLLLCHHFHLVGRTGESLVAAAVTKLAKEVHRTCVCLANPGGRGKFGNPNRSTSSFAGLFNCVSSQSRSAFNLDQCLHKIHLF